MAEVTPRRRCAGRWVVAVVCAAAVLAGAPVRAQESSRPTVEERFGEKSNSVYGHATVMTHVRNDFYDSFGLGGDFGYYPAEQLGLELRALYLVSSLSRGAALVKEQTGLTPDARPQQLMTTLGARYSIGYGKMLIGERNLLYFDPQVVGHGGIALAENRVLPTAKVGVSLLMHFRRNFQAKVDLLWAFQLEERNRGWVPSIGFVPLVGFGWNPSLSSAGNGEADQESKREGAP